MIKPEHLLSVIKINGLSLESSDEEILNVLVAAHYLREEAQETLQLIRHKITPSDTRTDGLHKIFFSDIHLQPQEVSHLLGINIEVTSRVQSNRRTTNISPMQFIAIWFVSLVIALTGILFYMYLNEIGLFHPTLRAPWE
jgi:hypothetical protein